MRKGGYFIAQSLCNIILIPPNHPSLQSHKTSTITGNFYIAKAIFCSGLCSKGGKMTANVLQMRFDRFLLASFHFIAKLWPQRQKDDTIQFRIGRNSISFRADSEACSMQKNSKMLSVLLIKLKQRVFYTTWVYFLHRFGNV